MVHLLMNICPAAGTNFLKRCYLTKKSGTSFVFVFDLNLAPQSAPMPPGRACRLYKLFNWLDPLMNFTVRPCEVKPFAGRTPRSNWLCKENEHQQNLFQCHRRFMAQFSWWRQKVATCVDKNGNLVLKWLQIPLHWIFINERRCLGTDIAKDGLLG